MSLEAVSYTHLKPRGRESSSLAWRIYEVGIGGRNSSGERGILSLIHILLIEQRFFSGEDSGLPTAPTVVGREVKLPGADWQSAPVSVLLQISSTCHFCNDSMPFYRKMMAARQASGAKIPVIVASADAVPVMQQHLADRQVSVDKVLHSRLDGIGAVTPTVYIVDSKGMIRRVFTGELDSSGQRELLSIVERGKV